MVRAPARRREGPDEGAAQALNPMRTLKTAPWSGRARSPTSTRRRSGRCPSRISSAVCGRPTPGLEAFAAQYGVRGLHRRRGDDQRGRRRRRSSSARPIPSTRRPTIAAAKAGVHVLVEKPLASSLADCDAMMAAAEAGGATIGIVSQRRFYPPCQRIRARPGRRHARHARARDRDDVRLARRGLLPQRSLARQLGGRGRRRPREPVAAPARPPPLVHGRGRRRSSATGPTSTIRRSRSTTPPSPSSGSRTAASGTSWSATARIPAINARVSVHGSNGASVGVQTDGGAMFIPGLTAIADAAFNDLWTIPGEERMPAQVEGGGRRPLPRASTPWRTSTACRSRISCRR